MKSLRPRPQALGTLTEWLVQGLPTGNQRPLSRRWVLRALRVTPGSTTTEKSSAFSSMIWSIWVRLMHTPPWWQD